MLEEQILNSVKEAISIQHYLEKKESLDFIRTLAKWLFDCYENQKKVLIAGNGGSLCDADHFAEELTGFFAKGHALQLLQLVFLNRLT
jgi:D-sedoheptulose 7-phosphate isomerase